MKWIVSNILNTKGEKPDNLPNFQIFRENGSENRNFSSLTSSWNRNCLKFLLGYFSHKVHSFQDICEKPFFVPLLSRRE